MPAPVVDNDGVDGNPPDDLFQGLKLWISRQVPDRSKWVGLVTRYGGEVLKSTTDADMIIADNVKKGGVSPTPGSYSYTWIQFSVSNGQLQPKDDHEILPHPSFKSVKSTRTPFTEKDDAILVKWVLKRERKGEAGNLIYQDLARQHPHHTWSSWRDRWGRTKGQLTKKFRDESRPSTPQTPELELEQDSNDAATPTQAAAAPPNHTKTSHQIAASPVKPSRPDPPNSERQQVQASIPPTETQPPRRKGMPFTEEEDQILMTFVQEARDRGDAVHGTVLYQELAEKHPCRSWQSWRERWVKHLSFRDANHGNQPQRKSPAAPKIAPPNRESLERLTPTTEPKSISSESAWIASSPGLSSEPELNPKSDDARLKRHEETKRSLRAGEKIQRIGRGYVARRGYRVLKVGLATNEPAFVALQSVIRGYLARRNAASRRAETCNVDGRAAEDDRGGSQYEASSPMLVMPRRDHDYFYSDLRGYVEVEHADVDFEPSIAGLRIDLWDLYRIATQQDCDPEQRDMGIVADQLGLDWRKLPGSLDELQQCYRRNLAGFEKAIKEFDEERFESDILSDDAGYTDDIQGEDLPQTPDAVMPPKDASIERSSPGYRSSPPVAGAKRPHRHDEVLSSGPGYPSARSRKRRRLDKGSVIPPTPERKLGYSTDPSQRSSVQNYTLPLQSRGHSRDNPFEMSDSDEESRRGTDQNDLPSHRKGSKQKYVEPEIRDWVFRPSLEERPQESDVYDSVELDDVSPSEQLRMESNEHGVPDQHVLSKPKADTRAKALPPSASSSNQKAGEDLAGGPRRSTRQRVAAQQSSTTPSRPATESRAKKRVLPWNNRQDAAPKAGARKIAPLLGTPKPKPLPQPQIPTSSKASAKVSVRTPKGAHRLNGTAPGFATQPTPSRRSSPTYDEEYMQAEIDHFKKKHYKMHDIVTAMKAATFQRGPTSVALERLNKGLGIPQNEPGIWTEQDTTDLSTIRQYESDRLAGSDNDQRKKVTVWHLRNRLVEKHGKDGFQRRQKLENTVEKSSKGKGKARAG